MMTAVRKEALRRGVQVINHVVITELLTSDGKYPTAGRVIGALGFRIRTGKICVFKAKSVVLCSGAWKTRWRAPANLFGEPVAAAFKVGAELSCLEVFRANDLVAQGLRCAPGTNIFMGYGARLWNAKGERFMEKYDPFLKEATLRSHISTCIFKELYEGRGPVYLDITHFTDEQFRVIQHAVPIVIATWKAAGYDPRKDRVPYHTRLMGTVGHGGVRVNGQGESNIPGLYAAGDASDNCHLGVHQPLQTAAVGGLWAGTAAAVYANKVDLCEVSQDQLNALQEELFTHLKDEEGLKEEVLYNKFVEAAERGLGGLRNKERLESFIEQCEEFKKDFPKLRAKDAHELAKLVGLKSSILLAQITAITTLHRRESRLFLLREDYPYVDNDQLKWIIAYQKNSGIEVREEPIPIDKYPFKPKEKKVLHRAFRVN